MEKLAHTNNIVLYSPIWPAKILNRRLKNGKAVITDIGREKRCPKCKEHWPADTQFYHSCPSSTDGLQNWCKACYGTWDRLRRDQKRALKQQVQQQLIQQNKKA